MIRLLPPLHEGHAPIVLHYAFEDALDAFERWVPSAPEPFVELEGRVIPIGSLFGRMRTCTDVMPVRILDEVKVVLGAAAGELDSEQPTYAEAARLLRAICVERLKAA